MKRMTPDLAGVDIPNMIQSMRWLEAYIFCIFIIIPSKKGGERYTP